MSELTIPIQIEDELKSSYLSYAMSVIINRAIPDARDGLKPVHRRILYAMHDLGFLWDKSYYKSARVIGEVIGKYHPHGDSAIYDALVRMAQDFSLLVPLIDGQGNFGSIDGDPAAAMRYTEVRLHYISRFLLEDINENSVDFRPNYDNSEEEPVVLPARFPNILVNGTAGVAVGMATNIPTHNLAEVIEACKLFIENPEAGYDEFLEVISGPDFPTGGYIIGDEGIKSAFETGRGSIILRGKTHFETRENKDIIIIDELPYQVNKARLIENIAHLVKEKRLEGISDIRDESNKDGIRVVIELKRAVSKEVLLNQLFQMTQLQTSYAVNMMLLDKFRPTLMSLKDVLAAFIEHRKEVITRRTQFRLNKARERANVLISIYVAILNIDEIIPMIKTSADNTEAINKILTKRWEIDADLARLIEIISNIALPSKEYYLSETQAKAILEIKLQRITGIEKKALIIDIEEEIKKIKHCSSILNSEAVLINVIIKELNEIKDRYPVGRKTVILSDAKAHQEEDSLIANENVVITVSHSGYIKRVDLSHYHVQKRGGKGKIAQDVKTEDHITEIFVINTHAEVLFFSNKGKVYKIRAYKLPAGEPQARGRALINIFNLQNEEVITSVLPIKDTGHSNLIFVTAKGKIKRNLMSDFNYVPITGKMAIKLTEEDKLISVKTCSDADSIFISTYQGKSTRFLVEDLRVFKGRASEGVKALSLSKGDYVIGTSILNGDALNMEERTEYLKTSINNRLEILKNEAGEEVDIKNKNEQFILAVTENGYGKITSSYEYRLTGRGGVGVINIVTSERNGNVVSSFKLALDHDIMLITNRGQVIRIAAKDISVLGRNTQGVKLFKLKSGEKVTSVTEVYEI